LPEANLNAELVAPASLSFDHARGSLVRGASNAQLEQRLGADPPLPDARERAKALAAAVPQVATAEEAAPFASRLRRLLDDGAYLRRMSSVGRAAALAFAAGCEGGLARLLAERVRGAGRARDEGGGEATAAANGVSLVEVSLQDLKPQLRSHAEADEAAVRCGARRLVSPARYRVTFKPMVYLRVAPATSAAILSIGPTGTLIEADATLATHEGLWVRSRRPVAVDPDRRGWALVHGGAVGLGELLALEEPGVYEGDARM